MNYFEIHNLSCSYNQRDIVLRVDNLTIPQGELVFIVGQSGCGKSTVLETLGLMNNTMLFANDSTFVFHTPNGECIDYRTVWSRSNKFISGIRLQYFSFIFQQTNLMRNFSIYENIAMTKMLQGANDRECKKTTSEILKHVGLEEFVTMVDGAWSKDSKVYCPPNEASGGQQQRMAFARAMVAEYCVLFCDEPTGNLDPETAKLLMAHLKDEVNRKRNATAIIVSHDLPLAVEYGDRIIKIFKKQKTVQSEIHKDNYYGYINEDSVLNKLNGQWYHKGNAIETNGIINMLRKWDDGKETV